MVKSQGCFESCSANYFFVSETQFYACPFSLENRKIANRRSKFLIIIQPKDINFFLKRNIFRKVEILLYGISQSRPKVVMLVLHWLVLHWCNAQNEWACLNKIHIYHCYSIKKIDFLNDKNFVIKCEYYVLEFVGEKDFKQKRWNSYITAMVVNGLINTI